MPYAPPALDRFYCCLLELVHSPDPRDDVDTVLQALVAVTGARAGQVEAHGSQGDRRWHAPGPDVACVERFVVDRVIETGGLVHVRTVETGAWHACAPITIDSYPIGIVGLVRTALGDFDESELARLKVCARELSLVADQLPGLARRSLEAQVEAFEERLVRRELGRADNNLSRVARELRAPRTSLYKIIDRQHKKK